MSYSSKFFAKAKADTNVAVAVFVRSLQIDAKWQFEEAYLSINGYVFIHSKMSAYCKAQILTVALDLHFHSTVFYVFALLYVQNGGSKHGGSAFCVS